ncbi:DUF2958 domain-containing protein [Oleidesulfovibrio alaskensis]
MERFQQAKSVGIPRLYETESIAVEDKPVHLHFTFGDSHWFAVEFDQEDICFGYVILNGDFQNAEWGYFSLKELAEVSIGPLRVELDLAWQVRPAGEVELIKLAGGIW